MSSPWSGRPVPPADLAGYVACTEDPAAAVINYEQQGPQIRDALVTLLGAEWSWASKRVLDFGCGSGRVVRHLVNSGAELYGCDIDARCVAWMQANLSEVDVVQSGERPPLAYADEQFDLIYATSVFSHLADTWADWLLELRRVLKPGGLLIASVMGAASSQAIAGEEWDADRIGMNVLGYARPWAAGGPMILHSEWWIRARWGRAFEIAAFVEGAIAGQDAVLLRRLTGPAPSPSKLSEPEPDEPRELAAARHTITQVNREHAILNASHDRYAEAYTAESKQTQTLLAELEASRAAPARTTRRRPRLRRLTRRIAAWRASM